MNTDKARLTIVPATLASANEFVERYHRHHGKRVGHKLSLAVADETGTVRGVAIVGRPSARLLDDGLTLEVLRVATDGCPNACSALYGAARRVARELGFRRLVTYILDFEPGTSLKASGWRRTGQSSGGSWSRPSRLRTDSHPLDPKTRWEVSL